MLTPDLIAQFGLQTSLSAQNREILIRKIVQGAPSGDLNFQMNSAGRVHNQSETISPTSARGVPS